jgi:hypothetical protein
MKNQTAAEYPRPFEFELSEHFAEMPAGSLHCPDRGDFGFRMEWKPAECREMGWQRKMMLPLDTPGESC